MAGDIALNLSKFRRQPFVNPDLTLTRDAAQELETITGFAGGVLGRIRAEAVVYRAGGSITATDVQGAITQLDALKADAATTLAALAGKQPLDPTLTALASLATAADQLIYATGSDVFALTALTAFARSLLDDIDAAAMRTTLGLGTLATQSGTFSGTHSGTSSGTNTGDQTITLTGDVTGSGTGSFAATVGNNTITYAKMQDVSAASVLLGRGAGAGAGDPQEITLGTGLTMTGTTLSASGGGGGSGTVTTVSVVTANGFAGTVANPGTTPAITLTTSLTGLLKGNGTAMSAAVAGTDYVAPGGALGTPSSGTLTNATGLPLTTGVTGTLGVGNGGTGVTTSTGSGSNVLSTSPTLTTPNIGAATGTSLTTTGAQLVTGGGIGYATGAGGTVTQLTSKATAVTLNKLCGSITTSNAALAASGSVSFTFNNSTIAAGDRIVFNHVAGGTFMAYHFDGQCFAGLATVGIRNLTAGSLGEAITIGFTIIKAVTA